MWHIPVCTIICQHIYQKSLLCQKYLIVKFWMAIYLSLASVVMKCFEHVARLLRYLKVDPGQFTYTNNCSTKHTGASLDLFYVYAITLMISPTVTHELLLSIFQALLNFSTIKQAILVGQSDQNVPSDLYCYLCYLVNIVVVQHACRLSFIAYHIFIIHQLFSNQLWKHWDF